MKLHKSISIKNLEIKFNDNFKYLNIKLIFLLIFYVNEYNVL